MLFSNSKNVVFVHFYLFVLEVAQIVFILGENVAKYEHMLYAHQEGFLITQLTTE
jgi:hypothetical protein